MSIPDAFQRFHNMHFNYLCRWNSPTFLWEVIEGRESRHLSNLKVIFLRPEQKKVRVIILNERSLEPRMLPWQPKFYQDQTFFLYNFLFLEFQWIRFSNYRVIVNLNLNDQHADLMTSWFPPLLLFAVNQLLVSCFGPLNVDISEPDKISKNSQQHSFLFFMHLHMRK